VPQGGEAEAERERERNGDLAGTEGRRRVNAL